ncbi:ferredoxin-type protein NapG [Aliiroseovarius lamellibrachiae]|uniref:ferredoxin-type protein NapG n=1 Tax=Aliiroseovarius lamellibrachiae TaxID=1924933 RepID=UPI001BE01BF3|nr:ferredoxin-type protein NapG [Aliiroseovarius lamellibrachiae]MBT2130645.1 ferredoxin-type protein NapG [Aliiroseovarius lamellibrachiae]
MSANSNRNPLPTNRRRFLQDAARAAGACAVAGMAITKLATDARALPVQAIRPPGALPEEDFLAACIRCGLCVRDCPYDTLVLAELGYDGPATGTPFFTARNIPCEMCDDIPCVKACPTGALDKGLTNIDDADMGLAVLIDEEHCLNALGLRCDVCYRVCPVIDKAITLERRHNERSGHHAIFMPVVHSDHCTGCGKCEKSCVLPNESAIKVLPMRVAQAEAAEHYKLGWEDRNPLVDELIDLPDRLPGPGTDNLVAPGGYLPSGIEGMPDPSMEGGFAPSYGLPGTGGAGQ